MISTFLLAAGVLSTFEPTELSLEIEDTKRTAIVYEATLRNKSGPVIFVFHGFTGSAKQAAFSYKMHEEWPEATVVYPQGLNVELLGRKAPGWQIAEGMYENRDLKFFDSLLKKLSSDFKVDKSNVFTCGMSNGAIFSYLLISERGKQLKGAAPVGGFAPLSFKGAPAVPILIIHGKTDPLIGINLAENSRDRAIENNKTSKQTSEWQPGYLKYEIQKNGKDVIWYAHEGGHVWPQGATKSIVKFFKSLTN